MYIHIYIDVMIIQIMINIINHIIAILGSEPLALKSIGGEVRNGVTSGVSGETSLNRHVTPHLHREYIHTYTYNYMYIYTIVYIYIYICIHYMYVYIYIYIYTHYM